MDLAVFDVDGVLADVEHRRHHVSGARRDWAAFFAAAADDALLEQGAALAHQEQHAGRLLVYLSGRPERLRAVTLNWLRHNGLPMADLVLRPDGDHSPAVGFKLDRLREMASAFTIDLLVDDDTDVVDAVRRQNPPLVTRTLLADWQPAGSRRALRRGQREGRT